MQKCAQSFSCRFARGDLSHLEIWTFLLYVRGNYAGWRAVRSGLTVVASVAILPVLFAWTFPLDVPLGGITATVASAWQFAHHARRSRTKKWTFDPGERRSGNVMQTSKTCGCRWPLNHRLLTRRTWSTSHFVHASYWSLVHRHRAGSCHQGRGGWEGEGRERKGGLYTSTGPEAVAPS